MNRPRPRARTLIAIALAVVLAGVAAAWLVPPLGPGSGGVATGPPDVEQTTNSQTGAAEIRFRPSGAVGWGVEVRNTTFLPVTIDGLHVADEAFLLDDVRLVLGTDPNYLGLEADHVRPFAPLTLAPGATQLIGIIGAFPACADARPNWATGVGISVRALRLDVRVAGVLPVESDVSLLVPVELLGDADAACA